MPTSDKSWQEWSRKVLEELVTLNARYEALQNELDDKHESLQTDISERYRHIDKKLEKMNELLNGNGTPEKGLIVRVDRIEQQHSDLEDMPIRLDRIEQREKSRTWLIRTTIVAAIGAIVTGIANLFSR